jgi:hypothetical protein
MVSPTDRGDFAMQILACDVPFYPYRLANWGRDGHDHCNAH